HYDFGVDNTVTPVTLQTAVTINASSTTTTRTCIKYDPEPHVPPWCDTWQYTYTYSYSYNCNNAAVDYIASQFPSYVRPMVTYTPPPRANYTGPTEICAIRVTAPQAAQGTAAAECGTHTCPDTAHPNYQSCRDLHHGVAPPAQCGPDTCTRF